MRYTNTVSRPIMTIQSATCCAVLKSKATIYLFVVVRVNIGGQCKKNVLHCNLHFYPGSASLFSKINSATQI